MGRWFLGEHSWRENLGKMKADNCVVASSAYSSRDYTAENTARILVRSSWRGMQVPLWSGKSTGSLSRKIQGRACQAQSSTFTPASRLARLNLFLALWETTWASVKHEKQYTPSHSCSGAPRVQTSPCPMFSSPAENREELDRSFMCQWWAFRFVNAIIRDLSHMPAVLLLPFFPSSFLSSSPTLSSLPPPFHFAPVSLHDSPSAEISHTILLIFSSHQHVTEDPTSSNSLALS